MYKYTIYTEDINRDRIEALFACSKIIHSYTLYNGIGVWQGQKEKNITIVIIDTEFIKAEVKRIATCIKQVNKQEAVLLTIEKVEGGLL